MKPIYNTKRALFFLAVAALSVCAAHAAEDGRDLSASSSSSSSGERGKRTRDEQASDRRCESCDHVYSSSAALQTHLRSDKHIVQKAKLLHEAEDYARGLWHCETALMSSTLSHSARIQIETIEKLCKVALDPQAVISPASSSSSSSADGFILPRFACLLEASLQSSRTSTSSSCSSSSSAIGASASSSSSSSDERSKRARFGENERKCEACDYWLTSRSFYSHLQSDRHCVQTAKWLCVTGDYNKGLAHCEKTLKRTGISQDTHGQIEALKRLCEFALNPQLPADAVLSLAHASFGLSSDFYCAVCDETFKFPVGRHVETKRHKEKIMFADFLQQQVAQLTAARGESSSLSSIGYESVTKDDIPNFENDNE